MSRIVALLLAALVAGGCSLTGALVPLSGPSPRGGASPSPSAATSNPLATPRPRPEPTPKAPGGVQTLAVGARDTSPSVSSTDVRALVRGNTAFAMDLYQRLRKGAGWQHRLRAVQHLRRVRDAARRSPRPDREADRAGASLHPAYRSPRRGVRPAVTRARLASEQAGHPVGRQPAVWCTAVPVPEGVSARDHAQLRGTYGRGRLPGRSPEAARKLINGWVARQTAQRITDLIPKATPPLLKKTTKLVLVNAIYMKAQWSIPFLRDGHLQPAVLSPEW